MLCDRWKQFSVCKGENTQFSSLEQSFSRSKNIINPRSHRSANEPAFPTCSWFYVILGHTEGDNERRNFSKRSKIEDSDFLLVTTVASLVGMLQTGHLSLFVSSQGLGSWEGQKVSRKQKYQRLWPVWLFSDGLVTALCLIRVWRKLKSFLENSNVWHRGNWGIMALFPLHEEMILSLILAQFRSWQRSPSLSGCRAE